MPFLFCFFYKILLRFDNLSKADGGKITKIYYKKIT
jgi:hypothetical protein